LQSVFVQGAHCYSLPAIAGIGAHMSDPMAVSRRLVAVFAADVESYKHG